MDLKNVALVVAALSAGGYLYNTVANDTLQNQTEYKEVMSKPSFDATEKLLLKNQDSDDYSLMSAYLRVWKSTMVLPATATRQTQLQALYDAGKTWVSKAVIDAKDLNVWLYIEKDASIHQIQTSSTPLEVADKALKLTEWNMKKIAVNSNYEYSYMTLDSLLADHTAACRIYNKYPQTKDSYQSIQHIIKDLSNTRAVKAHRGRGSINDRLHETMYTQPFSDPVCDTGMSLS